MPTRTAEGFPVPGEDGIGGTVKARKKFRKRLLTDENRSPIVDVERDFFEAWSMIEDLGTRPLDFVFLDVKLDKIRIEDEKIGGIINKFINDANITDDDVQQKLRNQPQEFIRRGGLYLFSKLMRKINEWSSVFPEIVVYTKSATIRTEFCSLQYALPGIFSIGNKMDSRAGVTIFPLIRSRSMQYMKMGEVSINSIFESVNEVKKTLEEGVCSKDSISAALKREIGNGWLFSTFFILQSADLINWRENIDRAKEAVKEIERILSDADFAYCLKRFFYDSIVRIFTHPRTTITLTNPPGWLAGNGHDHDIVSLENHGDKVKKELNECWESVPKNVRETLDDYLKILISKGLSVEGKLQLEEPSYMQQKESILPLSDWINGKKLNEFPGVSKIFEEIPEDFEKAVRGLIDYSKPLLGAPLLQHVYSLVRGKPDCFGQQVIKTLESIKEGLKERNVNILIHAEPASGMPESDYHFLDDGNTFGPKRCTPPIPSPIVFLPPTPRDGLGWPLNKLVIEAVETACEFHPEDMGPLKIHFTIISDKDSGTTSLSLHFPDVEWQGLQHVTHCAEAGGNLVKAIEDTRGWVRELIIESGVFKHEPLLRESHNPIKETHDQTRNVKGTNYELTVSCAFK